jgi:hypothetical protein
MTMLCNSDDKVLDLTDGELVEMRDVRGATLRVTRGTLWVTQDQDRRDVVLRAGDVWAVERQGLTLAEAQGAATVCVRGAAPRRITTSGTPATVYQRLSGWVESLLQPRSARRYVPYV